MMSTARVLLASALLAGLALSLQAEEKKKKAPPKKQAPFAALFQFPKRINLDEKQKAQLAKLHEEYGPKLADLAKKQAGIVPAARYKAANAARKKASDAILTPERVKAARAAAKGKKGKEANKAYQEALKLTQEEQKNLKGLKKVYDDTLNLTADEKSQLAAAAAERSKLFKEIGAKKTAVLTEEQKAALKPAPKPKKGKKTK